MEALLQGSTNVRVKLIHSQGHSCTRDRVSQHWNRERRSLAKEKAESNVEVQVRDFPGLFKALVRGASGENSGKN